MTQIMIIRTIKPRLLIVKQARCEMPISIAVWNTYHWRFMIGSVSTLCNNKMYELHRENKTLYGRETLTCIPSCTQIKKRDIKEKLKQ